MKKQKRNIQIEIIIFKLADKYPDVAPTTLIYLYHSISVKFQFFVYVHGFEFAISGGFVLILFCFI